MIRRLKSKLARRLRKWAEALAPEVKKPYIPFEYPILYQGKEYTLCPLRLSIPDYYHGGNQDALDEAYRRAFKQIGEAATMHIERDREYREDETVLQLLILTRK